MSFCLDGRSSKSGKTYSGSLHPKKSLSVKNTTDTSETCGAEEIEGNITRVSLELVEKRIQASLKLLTAQITNLAQLLNQVTEDKSAKITPTAGPRTFAHRRGPRIVGKPELLQPGHTQRPDARDFRPTLHLFCRLFSSLNAAKKNNYLKFYTRIAQKQSHRGLS